MTTQKMVWTFPLPVAFFIRVELLLVGVIASLVFLGTLFYYEMQAAYALVYTALFLVLYGLAAYFIRKARQAESTYHLGKKHLEITHQTRNTKKKEKVPLQHITRHKLDQFFLGGYVLTHKGKKHQLFFNTKKEVQRFEQFLKKHLPH